MQQGDYASNLKCLAYADDICVLLHDQNDLYRLQVHMQQNVPVSNAKFNENKSEAFSLNGKRDLVLPRFSTNTFIWNSFKTSFINPPGKIKE
jgi:hypothetical protein